MSRINLRDVSVSYYVQHRKSFQPMSAGAVGAKITVGGRYLEIEALRDINLSIENGDRVGLIGTNGSGKSTLLRLCAGALANKQGQIEIDGEVTAQFSLGSGIQPNLTGRRNSELKCLYMGIAQRAIAERVRQVHEISGLGPYFDLPFRTYSEGMKSRLVMSMMSLVRPDILVMDEWIGAADASIGKTASGLQRTLVESASILLIASHSKQVLADWTTKLAWLEQGNLLRFGPTSEVFAEYEAARSSVAARRGSAPAAS